MDEIEAAGNSPISEQEVKNDLSKMRVRNTKLAMLGMWVPGDHVEKREKVNKTKGFMSKGGSS